LASNVNEPPPTRPGDRFRSWVPTAAAVLIAAVLALIGLGNNLFWDDEANTALFARNLLEHGELTAWDGNNLIGYRHGAELDENLINVYLPRLQYYVAAIGFALFGEGTIGGRLPFVLIGLLGIAALAVLARNLLGDRASSHLPALLLAISPAFLLYIRNCRYYALGATLAVALLAAFSDRLATRNRFHVCAGVAAVGSAGLMLTNYFYSAGALATLPVLMFLERLRTRRHLVLLVVVYSTAALLAAWVYLTMNPLDSAVIREDSTPAIERLFTLLAWYLAGLGTFEFVPLAILPALFLPWYVQRLYDLRPFARRALVLLAALGLWVVITVAFTPQSVSGSMVADMRYLVPLIPLGTVLTTAALVTLWRLWRPLAIAAAALVVLSNIPYLAFLGDDNGFLLPRGAQCTLCRYVQEQVVDRTTASEAVVNRLRQIPDDELLLVVPGYMTYPAMFYLPHKRFCCQLDEAHPLRDELRTELPDAVFWERAEPTLALINRQPPQNLSGPLSIRGQHLGTYRVVGLLDFPSKDLSRPEIPWHAFTTDEAERTPHFPYLVVTLTQDR
jgi:hypothetical protein